MLTENELEKSRAELFFSTLRKIADDPINSIVVGSIITPGNKLVEIANILTTMQTDVKLVEFAKFAVSVIFELISSVNITSTAAKDKMWKGVNTFIISENELKNDLISFLNDTVELNCDTKQLFFCEFVMLLIEQLILLCSEKTTKNIEDPIQKLTPEEEQIVCYISGFIVFSLKTKYKRLIKSPQAEIVAVAALQFLKSLELKNSIKGDSFKEYVHAWVNLKSRGGLVKVNDGMFRFTCVIENIVRQTLTIGFIRNYKGEDLRDILYKKLLKDPIVAYGWENLSRKISNEHLKYILKRQIMKKWIDLRAKSYVNAYVQLLKHQITSTSKNTKPLQTGEPALRKTLF